MSKWEEKRLEDIIDVNPPVKLKKGESYPFIDIDKVSPTRRSVTNEEVKVYNGQSSSKFCDGDTVFSRITPCLENRKIAKVAIEGDAAFGSTEFYVFRAKKKKADARFTYYLTSSDAVVLPAINSMTGASGRQRADKRFIQRLKLNLPDLPTQERIVYCEGRAEPTRTGGERGFDAAVFNSIFGEKYPDTLFISSGGNTELDQRSEIAISILSKVFSDVEILVLKDRDMASGKDTTEADRQMYLSNNPQNHRVLNRFEIENYLYDKEVLKKYCEINEKTFDEAAYDAFVTDVVNQQIKDNTGHIRNFCGIVGSINAEVFKKNLAKVIDDSMQVYKELERVIFQRA